MQTHNFVFQVPLGMLAPCSVMEIFASTARN